MQPRYLLAMFALAACGDDAATPVDSGLNKDAAADARPDASPDASLAPPLFGDWVKDPDAWTDQFVQGATFRTDGTFTLVRLGDPVSGNYEVPSSGRLRTFHDDPTKFDELGFVIVNDQLLIDAFLPQGQVTGLVGSWTSSRVTFGQTGTVSLTIAADGTASTLTSSGTTSFPDSGTWVAEGTGLVITFANNHGQAHFRLLGGALGRFLFVKQP